MLSGEGHRALPAVKWEALGYGMHKSFYFNALISISAYRFLASQGLLAHWIGGAFAVVAVLLIVLRGRIRTAAGVAYWIAAVGCTVGILAIIIGGRLTSGLLVEAGAALTGAGCATLWILWGLRLSLLSDGELLFYVTVGLAAIGTLAVIGQFIGVSSAVLALFFALGSLFTLRFYPEGGERDMWLPLGRKPTISLDVVQLTKKSLATIYALLFVFEFAYHLSATTFFSSTLFRLAGIQDVLIVLILGLLLLTFRTVSFSTVYRFALPMIIVTYLLSSVLQFSTVWAVASGTGSKLASLFMWLMLIKMARGNSDKELFIVLSCAALSMLVGRIAAVTVASGIAPYAASNQALVPSLLAALLVLTLWLVLSEGKGRGTDKEIPRQRRKFDFACERISSNCGLTERETQVLPLIALGMSQNMISRQLHISDGTAHVHIAHIYRKLGVHSKQEIILQVQEAMTTDKALDDGGQDRSLRPGTGRPDRRLRHDDGLRN